MSTSSLLSNSSTLRNDPDSTNNFNQTTLSVHLNKTHGLFRTFTLMIGIMIGSGIFITVHHISEQVPNSGTVILIYFCMGCLSLMGCFCFAELGTWVVGKLTNSFLFYKTTYAKNAIPTEHLFETEELGIISFSIVVYSTASSLQLFKQIA